MKMRKFLAGLLCLAMTFGSVNSTALASAGEVTVSGNEVITEIADDLELFTVSDGDAGGTEGDSVSDNDTDKAEDNSVSDSDADDATGTVSGGDANSSSELTVSGGDEENADNTDNRNIDNTISSTVSDESDLDANLPYTIDENGVLTAWESAEGKIVIPDGVVTIGEGVFLGNEKITAVTMPETVLSIGKDAFKDCTKLETVRLPQSMEAIGDSAFEGCSAMYMVYLKETDYAGITGIGARAFAGCENLSVFMSKGEFVIPDSVTSIGNNAFESCYKLKDITLPKKLSTMGEAVFYDCQALTTVTLSSNYTKIPAETFKGCYSLNSITWSGTTDIGERAFQNCEALTVLTIPLSVAHIRSQAFADCTDLTFVVIENNSVSFYGAVFSDDHTTILCGEAGSEADYYQQGYSYLEFITKSDANKKQYPIDGSQIKKQLSGILVYCYTVETTNDVQKQVEVNKAVPGKEIYVQIQNIPAEYTLVSGSLKVNGEPLKEKESGVYSFVQKQGGATLTAEFAQVKYSDNLGVVSYETSESIENGLKVGQTVQLYLFSNKVTLETPLNGARFSFKNYDKTKLAVSVDSDGQVSLTGKAAGKTVLEIWNSYSGVKVKEIEIEIKSVALASMDLHITDSSSHIKEEAADEDGTRNLKVTERYVGNGLTFTVKANGWDAESTPLNVAYQWSTSDAAIAKPAKSTTAVGNNTNTITIPKGAGGEATVTVTAKDGSGLSKQIHIKVVDGKPSFVQENATFNFYKEKPMVVSLIESYGYAVYEDSLKLYDLDEEDKVTSVSKIFTIGVDPLENGKYIISSKTGERIEDGTYRVALDGETDAGHFSHKFTINVKNALPSVKVKQTGKINLFFSTNGKTQEVTLAVSGYGSEKIAAFELANLSAANDAALQADYNKFTENFEVDRATGAIRRKAETVGVYETGNDKGKVVATGNLLVYFEGYTEPKTVKITVATENKKPSYVLEKTSGTYNINRENPVSEIRLPVYEKQGKTLTQVALSEGGYEVSINFAKSNGFFMANDTQLSIEDDVIVVSTRAINEKGKLVMNLSNPDLWGSENYIELSYSVKVSGTQPKISLTKSKVSLNPVYQNQVAEFALKSNQPDCVISDTQIFEPVPNKKKGYNENIAKIGVTYEDGKGIVTIPENVEVKDGTYKFSCLTQVEDYYYVKGVGTQALNKVTLSVVVKNSVPSIKLKSTKFTMNLSAKGKETASQAVTVKNAPVADSGYELSEIVVLSGYTEFVDFVYEDGTVKATLREDGKFGAGNFKYDLVPVWSNGIHEVSGSKVRVTVAVQNKAVSVSVGSAKGKIDLLNRAESGISYKVTVKNIHDTMINPSIYELDLFGKPEETESTRFYAIMEDGKLVVKAFDDADITSGKYYSFKVKYSLATDPGERFTMNKVLKVKPTQTFPKLTQSTKNISLYQSNKGYHAVVTVTAKENSTATISGVTWAKGVDAKIKESFGYEILEIDETKNAITIEIWLNKNYRFAVGKTQTLKFAVECEGQDEATYGTSFSVKAAVNR